MKTSKLGVIAASLIFIILLAVFRFRPWNSNNANVPSQKEVPQSLTVGYLPVTCHLTCPVTDFASKTSGSNIVFNSKRFSDFPTIVSALEAKQIQATFLIVPLAMKLREQGVPIKICYLGHREGSQIVVTKNSNAKNLSDLKGKVIAIPSPYSNQNLVIHKLMKDQNMSPDEITFVTLPPPDMPASLAAGAVDAYFVGEPFCAKAELDGIGRVLYYAHDIWPDFVSCALVVHEDLIKEKPEVVGDLVRGIAESGMWAEKNREDAAKLASSFNRQDPELLNFVLTANPQRVGYANLTPTDEEIYRIEKMARDMGFLKKKILMSDLIDRTFIPQKINSVDIDINKSHTH